jgi:hypothetical protein
MHRRRRACERLRTASGFGCLQHSATSGNSTARTWVSDAQGRREVWSSAPPARYSCLGPAPRRRCCSSDFGSQRDVGARCRTRRSLATKLQAEHQFAGTSSTTATGWAPDAIVPDFRRRLGALRAGQRRVIACLRWVFTPVPINSGLLLGALCTGHQMCAVRGLGRSAVARAKGLTAASVRCTFPELDSALPNRDR